MEILKIIRGRGGCTSYMKHYYAVWMPKAWGDHNIL